MAFQLTLKDLTKAFGGIVAVDRVNVTIGEAQLVGFIGPNGAGKTTLVNLISGVFKPTAGAIHLNEKRIDGLPSYRIAEAGIARTFQITQVFSRLSVLENLLVPGLAINSSQTRHDLIPQAKEVLEFFALEHLQHENAKNLSGGQKKLLEMARALMLKPKLFCLDEPFAGVHPELREKIKKHIQGLHQDGISIVMISHDMSSIFDLSKRVLVLNDGTLIADGVPEEVKEKTEVIDAYLGDEVA